MEIEATLIKNEVTVKEDELREMLNERKSVAEKNEDQKRTIEVLREKTKKQDTSIKKLEDELKEKHKTKFCWNCIKEIPYNEFRHKQNDFRKGICNRCIDLQNHKLETEHLEVVEKDRKSSYSGWHRRDVTRTEVFLKEKYNGEQKFFIRAYIKGEPPYDTEVFTIIEQFLRTDKHFVGADPVILLSYMDKGKYSFGRHYECALHWHKDTGIWEFHGNLEEISHAFRTVIYNKSYAKLLAQLLKGRKHVYVDLKESIWDYKDKHGIKVGENIWDFQEKSEVKQ